VRLARKTDIFTAIYKPIVYIMWNPQHLERYKSPSIACYKDSFTFTFTLFKERLCKVFGNLFFVFLFLTLNRADLWVCAHFRCFWHLAIQLWTTLDAVTTSSVLLYAFVLQSSLTSVKTKESPNLSNCFPFHVEVASSKLYVRSERFSRHWS
jgi:hypothetical protein